jgi:hypothetical protein
MIIHLFKQEAQTAQLCGSGQSLFLVTSQVIDFKFSFLSHEARNWSEAGSKFCLAYSPTLKMDATCSSETLVHYLRTTRRYIPKERTLLAFSFYQLKPDRNVSFPQDIEMMG